VTAHDVDQVDQVDRLDVTAVGPDDDLRAHWATQRRERRRRWRWRLVLLVGVGVLVVYYGLAVGSLRGHDASTVQLDDSALEHPRSRVTLQVEAVDLDTSAGSFEFQLRPVPSGVYESNVAGELNRPLQVVVSSPGQPAQTFEFAEDQLVDPVAVSVAASTGARGFPFDRPRSSFAFAAQSRDDEVPIDLEMVDETEGWNLSAVAGPRLGGGERVEVDLRAGRETLAISFALFHIAGIVVVALITVAVIGGAVVRGLVDFNQVIWLGAMLVAIPAVRNEMPGVPPVGTAVDLFVLFPSIVIVGVALLAGVIVLAINEAAANRATAASAGEVDRA
jgi:hypothetical protein